jgi:hypothetical protein
LGEEEEEGRHLRREGEEEALRSIASGVDQAVGRNQSVVGEGVVGKH